MADNVFDKLDEQSLKIDKLTEQVANITDTLQKSNNQEQQTKNIGGEPVNKQRVIEDFLLKSSKNYRWFGNEKDFYKDKTKSVSFLVCVIAIGLISTILTSASLGIYSTFTLFENIMVFATCWQLGYVCKLQLTIPDIELALHSTEVFTLNNDNLMVSTNKEKKRYKISRILCYIAIVCNIISIWTFQNSSKSVIATIFEIIFLGVIIAARWFYCNLTCMYNFVYFSAKTYDGQLITLVWNGQQELITKEEFDKKYIYLK